MRYRSPITRHSSLALCAALLLTLSPWALAGPYAETTLGVEGHRQTTAVALGFKTDRWFVQAVKPFFADVADLEFIRDDGMGPDGLGGGVTMTWESHLSTRTSSLALHAGRIFRASGIEIGPFAGAHRYRQVHGGVTRLVKIDQATGEEIIDRAEYIGIERSGWAPTYGVAITAPLARDISIVARLTRYDAIDRRSFEFGLRIDF